MLRFGHCFGYGNDIFDEGLHADWNRGSEVATRPGSRFCCVFCLVTGGFGGFGGGFWVFATRRWMACFSRVFGVFGLVGFALVAGLV